MKVRWAELGDLHDLYQIHANDGERHHRALTEYPVANWLAGENRIFFVAEESKLKKVGFLIGRRIDDEVKIDHFSIDQDYPAKKEVKEAMLNKIHEVLPDTKVTVLVRDRKDKQDFYESIGFEIMEKMHNAFGEGRDGFLMTKSSEPRRVRKVINDKTVISEILKKNLDKLDEQIDLSEFEEFK